MTAPRVHIAAFPVFNALPLTGLPRNGVPGLLRAKLVYGFQLDGNGLWDGPEHDRVLALPDRERSQSLPPRDRVQRIAKACRPDSLLVFDYEEVQIGDDNDLESHANEYRSYGQVARWVREANPYVRFGFYSPEVDGRNAARGLNLEAYEANHAAWLELAAPYVDYCAPSFYVSADTDMAAWRQWVAFKVKRLREARKPVYAFVNVDGPPDKVAEAWEFLRGHADGLILWCNPGAYDRRASWLKVLAWG